MDEENNEAPNKSIDMSSNKIEDIKEDFDNEQKQLEESTSVVPTANEQSKEEKTEEKPKEKVEPQVSKKSERESIQQRTNNFKKFGALGVVIIIIIAAFAGASILLNKDNEKKEEIILDSDGDGIPDVEDNDDDNDGVKDENDAFPLDSKEWLDTDGDLVGNNADADDDNDGFPDSVEIQAGTDPLDKNSKPSGEQKDTDGDGIPDSEDEDDDNDSYNDTEDDFPLDKREWLDTDRDGTGNNADLDDDNDGYNDTEDDFPLDKNEWLDTDNDGIGNNADTDDDNDGYNDIEDDFPLDKNKWIDTDVNKIKNFSFCELFVTTMCGACSEAEENLNLIYEEENYNFHFVTMITDKNDDANDRANDYGVQYVPTAEFNGGTIEKVGSSSKSKEEYKKNINKCLNETAFNVSIEVSIEKIDNSTIKVKVEEFSNQCFEGYLRVYVVEKVSRHNNSEDKPIPYGFLGYAFNNEIKLNASERKNEENNWSKENIDYENLLVIGTIFDKNGYALALDSEEGNESKENENSKINHTKDFSLCELFVTTGCTACPTAEENLKSIYDDKNYNFHFVTMIMDKNDDANDRANDYGVQYVPTAEFNGGTIEEVGGKSKEYYEKNITTCLNESAINVTIKVSMEKVNDDTIKVKVEEFSNQSFEGYLRVYVVEKVSRYKNSNNEQIPFGFLGYGFDKEIQLLENETKKEENKWSGDDIDYENLVVIGTIFDKDGYAVASYLTEG